MAWFRDWWYRDRSKKDDSLSEIRDCKALFEKFVIAADAAGSTYPQALVAKVLARFNDLETQAGRPRPGRR